MAGRSRVYTAEFDVDASGVVTGTDQAAKALTGVADAHAKAQRQMDKPLTAAGDKNLDRLKQQFDIIQASRDRLFDRIKIETDDREVVRLNRTLAQTDRDLDALQRRIDRQPLTPDTGAGGAGLLERVNAGWAAASAAVGATVVTSLQGAATVQQAQDTLARSFGASGSQVAAWATGSADALGVTEAAALQTGLALQTAVQASGVAAADQARLVSDLGQRAADLAAAQGRSIEDVTQAIGGALRGEFDSIQELGVALDPVAIQTKAVALGLAQQGEEVTGAAQAQATYALVMERTANVQGAVAASSGTLSGALRDTQKSAGDLAAALGDSLGTVVTPLLGGVNDLVQGFTDLPGPARNATLAVTATGVALVFLNKQVERTSGAGAVQQVSRLRGAYLDLRDAVGRAGQNAQGTATRLQRVTNAGKSAIGAVGGLGGVAGMVAVGALVGLAGSLDNVSTKAKEFRDSLQFAGGALTENARQQVAATLATDGALDSVEALGLSTQDYLAAVTEGGPALDAYRRRLQDMIDAGTQWTSGRNPTAVQTPEARAAEKALDDLDRYAREVEKARTLNQQVAAAAFGTTAQYEAQRDAVEETNQLLDDTLKRLDLINGRQLTAIEAQGRYQEAIDAANEGLDRGAGLNQGTEAGRANVELILDQVRAIEQLTTANLGNAQTADDVAKVEQQYAKQRDTLIDMVDRVLPGARQEAEAYVDQLLATPDEMKTNVALSGVQKALGDLGAVEAAADGIPDVVNTAVGVNGAGAVQTALHDIDYKLDALDGRRVSPEVVIRWRNTGDRATNPGAPGGHTTRAEGGPVIASAPRMYLVGEKGPELLVPSSNGTIVSNERLVASLRDALAGNGSGGDVAVNVWLDGELVRGVARAEVSTAFGGLARSLRHGRRTA